METTFERCGTPRGANPVKLSRITRSSQKTASESLRGNVWPSEKLPQCHLRKTINSDYGGDFNTVNNLKHPDVKSSDESVINGEIVDQINYPDYETAGVANGRQKATMMITQDSGYELETRQGVGSSTYPQDHPDSINSPTQSPIYQLRQRQQQPKSESARGGAMLEAVAAEHKLQKLKELQRKRELTERYYSQEIRKLITEYYKTSCGNAGDSLQNKKLKPEKPSCASAGTQRGEEEQQRLCCKIGETEEPRASSLDKPLEPCGTMTTITRLDCGCMQETTRPIFTTPEGRVENRNCRHGQDPAVLRLAPANPHEHLSASNCTETRGRLAVHSPSGPRLHRPGFTYPRIVTRTCCAPERTFQAANMRCESGHGRTASFTGKIDPRRSETVSGSFLKNYRETRNVSPLRKYSDTSTD